MQKDNLPPKVVITTREALFLQTIKKRTAEQHVLLESQPLLSSIMMTGVTVRQYCYYLILMKKIAEVYEANVLILLDIVFPEHTQRKMSQLIEEDLQSIGDVLPDDIISKDYTLPVEKLSVPFALGFMYVMEGSKLGGKVIFKHIHRTLGFTESRGAKYISDYGAGTVRLWKEFLTGFSGYITENNSEDVAIEGAKYAFTSIYDFFESNQLAYEI